MKYFRVFLYERAPPVVVWGALALTGYTRISLPQIHFRAKSSESILVVLECLHGHLVASCGSNYRFRRLGAPMPCGAGSSINIQIILTPKMTIFSCLLISLIIKSLFISAFSVEFRIANGERTNKHLLNFQVVLQLQTCILSNHFT